MILQLKSKLKPLVLKSKENNTKTDRILEQYRLEQDVILEYWKAAGCPEKFIHPTELVRRLKQMRQPKLVLRGATKAQLAYRAERFGIKPKLVLKAKPKLQLRSKS